MSALSKAALAKPASSLDTPVSEAEYLALEAESDEKHAYVDGRVLAMSGASKAHNLISLNLAARFLAHLKNGPCKVYIADVKCRIELTRTYLYPDVMVVCDDGETPDSHFVDTPTLVVEVLSPGNEVMDWLAKLDNYRMLKSLKEYVLLRQDSFSAYVFERQEEGAWTMKIFGEGDDIRLNSIDLTLPIADVYAGVHIPRPSPMEDTPQL